MRMETQNWKRWREFFAARSERRLPGLDDPQDYSALPKSLARSLAIFQLGESGGGSVVHQAAASTIPAAGPEYASAMRLFVAEEHRHAEILAICVRNLGGTLIHQHWTAKLFVRARRLLGLRLKVMVLLSAEVVGICYYHLLATRLPAGRLRSLLAQLVNDERSHLHFHCEFLRSQVTTGRRRWVFVGMWRAAMFVAAGIVLLDHRQALRDMGLSTSAVWRRWTAYSRLAERLICRQAVPLDADLALLREPAVPRRVLHDVSASTV